VRYGDRKWTFWQYRSDGRVPGITGAVDQNTFNGSADHWRNWLAHQTGLSAAPVAARPADDRGSKQLIEEDPAMVPQEKDSGFKPPASIEGGPAARDRQG
jgi:lysozyme